MPEPAVILLLADGNLGDRVASLLARHGLSHEVRPGAAGIPESALPLLAPGSSDPGGAPRIVAIAADHPFPHLEEQLDDLCWAAGTPWLSANFVAGDYRVGPVVLPGITPCFECFRRRSASLAPDPEQHRWLDQAARTTNSRWFEGSFEPLVRQAAAVTAAELAALATGTYQAPPLGAGRGWRGGMTSGAPAPFLHARIGLCARCGANRGGRVEGALATHWARSSQRLSAS